MMPLAGYSDRLSVRPGATIAFKVANATGRAVEAKVVRVICADPNPAGPGIKLEPSAAIVRTMAEPAPQHANRGSSAQVALGRAGALLTSFTALALVKPTLPGKRAQAIIALGQGSGTGSVALVLDAAGHLAVTFPGRPAAMTTSEGGMTLAGHAWALVWFSYDAATKRLSFGMKPARGGVATRTHPDAVELAAGGFDRLTLAALDDTDHFDGCIERPMLFDRALTSADVIAAAAAKSVAGLVATWDFSVDVQTSRLADTGPHGLNGSLINSPARAMRGASWTGREQCFRHAPAEYGAIHFHSDDIDDCRWPTTHTVTVPEGMRSGAYALMLEAGEARENIPFFVVPERGKAKARIALLISTFTYTVYHNHARPEWSKDQAWQAAWQAQAAAWPGAYRHNGAEHPDYGWSTYNTHGDGSGIHLASWHRPMLTMRIGYITYPYPEIRGSGLRHFPADTHLIAWLEHFKYDYDVITDWELDREGYDLLGDYQVVMTGSHPEYHTSAMLDALEQYRDCGGRFMYMGGNGFYWKIALSPEMPGQIEIRRAEGGIRAWAAEPGEYYNQFDGEYGGLWRRNGRPPQKLAGVGFTAQGNFIGSYYRVRPEARDDPRVAWIFAGVAEAEIGAFGLSGHGAAGFELDRADKRLGTPDGAIIVAQSEDHPPEAPWVLVPEEQLTHIATLTGETWKQLVRADMTFFTVAGGGAVFSTGSITYCGSLPHNGFENNISRVTRNVLDRFLDASAKFA